MFIQKMKWLPIFFLVALLQYGLFFSSTYTWRVAQPLTPAIKHQHQSSAWFARAAPSPPPTANTSYANSAYSHHIDPSMASLPSQAERRSSMKYVLHMAERLKDRNAKPANGFKGCPVEECSLITGSIGSLEDLMEKVQRLHNVSHFDAVVIFSPSYHDDKTVEKLLKALTPFRSPAQRWIFRNRESPRFSQGRSKGKSLHRYINRALSRHIYNWTWTYRPDSDILTVYHSIYAKKNDTPPDSLFWIPKHSELKVPSDDLHEKKKLVFWAVSNCHAVSRRDEYVKELKKYIPIDILGKCGTMPNNNCTKGERIHCTGAFGEEYKFYLAFENSICEEYITEKFERTLAMPVVPIALGGGPYERYYPNGSYIDVFDFKTPKDLADYLMYLDKNKEEYQKFFEWKKDYTGYTRQADGWCEICAKLHDPKEPAKSYPDIDKWWYQYTDGTSICELVESGKWSHSLTKHRRDFYKLGKKFRKASLI